MKKKLIRIIERIVTKFNGSANAELENLLAEKCKQAHERTMKVVNTAKEYNVRAQYGTGSSNIIDVVEGVYRGNLQNEILQASEAIDSLEAMVKEMKSTLEVYQQSIYQCIEDVIKKADEVIIEDLTNIHEDSNLVYVQGREPAFLLGNEPMNKIDFMEITSNKIHGARVLTEDLLEPIKSRYNLALDESKAKVFKWLSDLVVIVEKTKNQAFKDHIDLLLKCEKRRHTNLPEEVELLDSLMDRINRVTTKPSLTKMEIVNHALNDGFEKVTDFNKLPYGFNFENNEIVKRMVTKKENANQLVCITFDNEVVLYSKDNDLTGAENFIRNIAPIEADLIFKYIKSGKYNGFLTTTGLICMCIYNWKYNCYAVVFYTFK